MKKLLTAVIAMLMISALILTACSNANVTASKDEAPSALSATSAPSATSASSALSATSAPSAATAETAASAESIFRDPYATENRYDIPASMFEKQSGVDYGRLDKDVTYYSTVAGDDKQVNVLLPAGYDESRIYPVMYVVHGFDANHNSHVGTDSYLTLLYGNMLNEGLAVPMILVGIDMYTDKLADKEEKTFRELRYLYDKVIDEIKIDLMPFIEQTYPVSTERKDTAVAGVSEGGAKSLCIGFNWLDEFGWIGGFAPDANVIPTGEDPSNYWFDPYMEAFPQPNESNTPYYVYMAVGSEDPWNIDCTFLYRDKLNEIGVKNQTDYAQGYGHDSEFWGQCYYNYLTKVFQPAD